MNQSFLKDILRRDVQVVLFGAVEARGRSLQIINPDYEVIGGDGEDGEPTRPRRFTPGASCRSTRKPAP